MRGLTFDYVVFKDGYMEPAISIEKAPIVHVLSGDDEIASS